MAEPGQSGQVKDGKNFMLHLLPAVIKTMFKEEDWGPIEFPVIKGSMKGIQSL